jgi:protein TonB
MTGATTSHVPPAGGSGEPTGPVMPVSPGPAVVSHGWLAANSTFEHADDRKMGRAFSTSVGVHGLAVVLILIVMSLKPPAAAPVLTPPEKYDLVFVQAAGPGGGGGGGGNSTPTPPAKLEMKAELPKAPKIEPPKVVDTPPPPPQLIAPVQMTAVMPTAGTLTGMTAAPSAGLGRGGGGGTGVGTGTGPGTGSGIGPGTGGGFGGGAMRPGSGVENPTILRDQQPKYTPDAMRAKIQGVVELEAVVGVNGVITEIRVIKSLDRAFGLDEEAMRTAKQWLFRPGTFQGKPVPILVVIQMEFRLH